MSTSREEKHEAVTARGVETGPGVAATSASASIRFTKSMLSLEKRATDAYAEGAVDRQQIVEADAVDVSRKARLAV